MRRFNFIKTALSDEKPLKFSLDREFIIDLLIGPPEQWSRTDAKWVMSLYGEDTSPPTEEFISALDEIRHQREQQGENVDLLYAMSLAERRSLFPESPENQNDDFQAGYAVGLTYDSSTETFPNDDPRTTEWKRRNRVDDESFRTWKRGYSAGCFAAVLRKHPPPSANKR